LKISVSILHLLICRSPFVVCRQTKETASPVEPTSKNLEVWQKSHLLALSIYRATVGYPNSERFGLISQMRRAASSIPANIAQGCERGANAEFRQFLYVATGSANELIYFLLRSKDLGFLAPKHAETLDKAANDVKQMLTRLIQSVQATSRPASRTRPAAVNRGSRSYQSSSSGGER
jgi:four helix bundle protein